MSSYLTSLNLNAPPAAPEEAKPAANGAHAKIEALKEAAKNGVHAKIEELKGVAKNELKVGKDFFHDKKDAELFGLQVGSYLATGGALLLSGMPVVGNVLNLANFFADGMVAVERYRAYRAGHETSTRADIAADLAGVLIDFAGIFYPPVQWWGQGSVAIWDISQTYIYHRTHFPPLQEPPPAENPK